MGAQDRRWVGVPPAPLSAPPPMGAAAGGGCLPCEQQCLFPWGKSFVDAWVPSSTASPGSQQPSLALRPGAQRDFWPGWAGKAAGSRQVVRGRCGHCCMSAEAEAHVSIRNSDLSPRAKPGWCSWGEQAYFTGKQIKGISSPSFPSVLHYVF